MYVRKIQLKQNNKAKSKINAKWLTYRLKLKLALQTRRKEYFGWSRVLMHLFLGLGLYVIDVVTDVLVVVQYYHYADREGGESNVGVAQEESSSSFPTVQLNSTISPDSTWLFYIFTFFVIVPNIVYNIISFCLYIIGDVRLRHYIRSWLTTHVGEGSADAISIQLFSNKFYQCSYYCIMILFHLFLLGPIFRLLELLFITSTQVKLRSKTTFYCLKCKENIPIKTRCLRHHKFILYQSKLSNLESASGSIDTPDSFFDETDVISREEMKLKLAHADALQSWADCKFLQFIESNLESLPQLTIQTFCFFTNNLAQNHWINYLAFLWSVLTFSYTIASFKHMPYDYDAISHREDKKNDKSNSNSEPSESKQSSNQNQIIRSYQVTATKFNSQTSQENNSSIESSCHDEVDEKFSEHCTKCCRKLLPPISSSPLSSDKTSRGCRCCRCCSKLLNSVGRRLPKFVYTACMGLIVGPRVFAIIVLAYIDLSMLFWGLIFHSFFIVLANLFSNIRICYKILEYMPDAQHQDESFMLFVPQVTNVSKRFENGDEDRQPNEAGVQGSSSKQNGFAEELNQSYETNSSKQTAPSTSDNSSPQTNDKLDFRIPFLNTEHGGFVSLGPGKYFQPTTPVESSYLSEMKLLPMRDVTDGTLTPITFVGIPKTKTISRTSNLLLWIFAASVQLVFNFIITTPFIFYFLHVQDIKHTRVISTLYYIIWYLENLAIVFLSTFYGDVQISDTLDWPARQTLLSCSILFVPIAGFLILGIYHSRLHPEKQQKSDHVDSIEKVANDSKA